MEVEEELKDRQAEYQEARWDGVGGYQGWTPSRSHLGMRRLLRLSSFARSSSQTPRPSKPPSRKPTWIGGAASSLMWNLTA